MTGTLDPVLHTDCLAVAQMLTSIGAHARVGVVLEARHTDGMTVDIRYCEDLNVTLLL